MPTEFRYFRAPESEMRDLLPGSRTCSVCGQIGRCFRLKDEGQIGCYDCLRRDRFGFDHTTDSGDVTEEGLTPYDELDDEPKRVFLVSSGREAVADSMPLVFPSGRHVSEEAVAELRRTPNFSTWQEVSWPVHHENFMAYLGIWGPKDFDGRDSFVEIVGTEFSRLWPLDAEPRFGENIVVFERLHCKVRTGIPDFD